MSSVKQESSATIKGVNRLFLQRNILIKVHSTKKKKKCMSNFTHHNYATYNNKKAIINANNPVASAKANPNIAYEKGCPLNEGFLATPKIRAPNITPIPSPAPIKPVVASPVPIIFVACMIYRWIFIIKKMIFYPKWNHV